MTVHILGLGPITTDLAKRLTTNHEVQIYSNQKFGNLNNQLSSYETLLTVPIATSDIFLLAWKDLADDDLLRHEVLTHLSRKLTPQNTVFNLSSVAIYGDNNFYTNEFTDPLPINTYGTKKLYLENLYDSLFASKICHLRISNVFGDPRFNDVVNKFIFAIQNEKAVEIWGEPNTSRDYISLQTVVEKIVTCVQNLEKLETRGVMNICSGNSISLQEVVEMIEEIINRPIQVKIKKNIAPMITFSTVSSNKFDALFTQLRSDESEKLRSYLSASLIAPPIAHRPQL